MMVFPIRRLIQRVAVLLVMSMIVVAAVYGIGDPVMETPAIYSR